MIVCGGQALWNKAKYAHFCLIFHNFSQFLHQNLAKHTKSTEKADFDQLSNVGRNIQHSYIFVNAKLLSMLGVSKARIKTFLPSYLLTSSLTQRLKT